MLIEILPWLGVFLLALGALVKASDWFIDSAEKIGLSFGISPFIIGVTIVAAGTSLPELASSIVSIFQGSSEFVAGNVIGSNITNIFLVLGVSAIISKKINISYDLMHIDIPLLIGSAFLLYFFLYDGHFSLMEAILCIVGLILFLAYTFNNKDDEGADIEREPVGPMVYGLLLLSGVLIYFGAEWTIKSVTKMSEVVGVGKDIVALTLVAFGTSVPELIVSAVAAKKGNPEIAIGNILGSNIFNTYAVMGIPALFGELTITPDILEFSLPFMLVATFMFLLVTINKKVSMWEGMILVLFYAFFIVELFSRHANG